MDGNLVITIGRQCGSMGNTIGRKLADTLGIKCYNKELLTEAAKNSGLCKEIFEKHDENTSGSFLYSFVMDTYSMGYGTSSYMNMPINHQVFLAQFETIKKIAREESCIFVGRCADYALADFPNVVTVFITGNEEDKIRRLMELHHVNESKAKDIMIRSDKNRSSYYNYYSGKKWGDSRNYDLCINSSSTGADGAVSLICEMVRLKEVRLKEQNRRSCK